ncbi:MAG: aminodeoxychorismate/anthranilate synthase component II [Lactobacillus sp.]|jgi:anthranilate synthase component 2|nr:aminodeoxychorismate/anthranilate synthase component II [Lactobacillus sp.]
MLTIVDNYDSFTYNLYQLVGQLTTEEIQVIKNDELSVQGLKDLHPDRLLFSPGPGNPDEAGNMLAYLDAFIGQIPILGVCLGHQAIGEVYGGQVVHSPKLMHGKASTIYQVAPSPLFDACPATFAGARYHSLTLANLPDELTVTATTQSGEIMAVADAKRQVYGVQFHPESILTTASVGSQLIQNFVKLPKPTALSLA